MPQPHSSPTPTLHSILNGENRVISPLALLGLPLHHYIMSYKENMGSLALQPCQLSLCITTFCLTRNVQGHQPFSLASSPSPSLHSVLQGEYMVISPLALLALPLHHFILSCKGSIGSLALQPHQLSLSSLNSVLKGA